MRMSNSSGEPQLSEADSELFELLLIVLKENWTQRLWRLLAKSRKIRRLQQLDLQAM